MVYEIETQMIFNRQKYSDLKAWQSRANRKPLLLIGARQIGKTTLLKSFGNNEYKDMIYINLERQVDFHEFFKGNKDPKVILSHLALAHGKSIEPHTSLIILDVIQACRDAVISLKYFNEEFSQFHIVGAGSLLGISLGNDRSFPVGQVEFLDMYPLYFSEYLAQANHKLFIVYQQYLDFTKIENIPIAFFKQLQTAFKEYILIGGMPEVAKNYLENQNINEAQIIQDDILRAFELDFVKHADKTTSTKIQQVWDSLPSQLAKENKKFIYKYIHKSFS